MFEVDKMKHPKKQVTKMECVLVMTKTTNIHTQSLNQVKHIRISYAKQNRQNDKYKYSLCSRQTNDFFSEYQIVNVERGIEKKTHTKRNNNKEFT